MKLQRGNEFLYFLHTWNNLWIVFVDCSIATNYTYHITLKVFICLLSYPQMWPLFKNRDYNVSMTLVFVFGSKNYIRSYLKNVIHTKLDYFLNQRILKSYSVKTTRLLNDAPLLEIIYLNN